MADQHEPDVSVIVPVYNTMPYLTRTLDSLLAQTLAHPPGPRRLQVIAVDDGSTDGSGEELDRYAAAHPDVFVVVHQPNSGGPATPCNRGLELARGRYVFFLGADDYLGEEALERLVAKADKWGSDVIFGRMVGVGGRYVDQRIFAKTRKDLDLIESDLAFALSNTKLYRRSLVLERDLHFSRDLRVGSDQPFTIDAVTHAKRVSVLADYTYYYAVKRADETNISYSTRWRQRVGDIGAVMDHVAALTEPGAQRDAFLRRHFAWELTKVLNREFPGLTDDGEQAELVEAVGALADRYLTDGVVARLGFPSRLALRLTQARDVATLRALVAIDEPFQSAPLRLAGDRVYAVLPGFRDSAGHPDDWYDVTDKSIRKRVKNDVVVRRPRLDGHTLAVSGTVPFTADSVEHLRLSLVRLEAKVVPKARRRERGRIEPGADFPVSLTDRGPDQPTALSGELDLRALLDDEAPDGTRWAVRLRADAGPWTYDVPVGYQRDPLTTEASRGLRRASFTARRAKRGYLFVEREMLPAELGRRVLRRALSR